MQIDLLHILGNKDKYYTYRKYIKEHVLTEQTVTVVNDLDAFYKLYTEMESVDWDIFEQWFRLVKHPNMKLESLQLFSRIFRQLKSYVPDGILDVAIIQQFIAADYATQIADKALRVVETDGDEDIEDVGKLYYEYEEVSGKAAKIESLFVPDDIEQMMDAVNGKGLSWRLPELNESLGDLRKGDFVIVGARPEVGKTTFLASETTHFGQQLDASKDILWINNEEQGYKVKFRLMQAALGWTKERMMWDFQETVRQYKEVMNGTDIKIVDEKIFSIYNIDMLLKKYDFGLIIFDQLRKVRGYERESGKNEVLRQELLFGKAREWASLYAPVIDVHQASGEAEGKDYLTMDMLHNSKVGIQGEADAVIMIGKKHDPGFEYTRFINICKNKLAGSPESKEHMRHGRYEVLIKPEIARYESP